LYNCYSTGTVSGHRNVGGFAGSSGGRTTNCYCRGAVFGQEEVGGFLGAGGWHTNLTNCYCTGAISGGGATAGFGSEAIACFWDRDTTGVLDGDAGQGLSTPEMQNVQTYLNAGWDVAGNSQNGLSEIWRIPAAGGYPEFCLPPQLPGQGTPDDPYLIATGLDLGAVYYDPIADYKLTNSIDLSGMRFSGPVIPEFAGSFDGNDFVISSLTIVGESYLGLFGRIAGDAVRNLGVTDVNVTGEGDYVGALAGSGGTVSHCYSTGTVCGGAYVGGLLGGGSAYNCQSSVTVFGEEGVGGLLGFGSAYDCQSSGSVFGEENVGGLLGSTNDNTVVLECSSSSAVIGDECVGGLVGRNGGGQIRYSYCAGTVSGDDSVGGLVGRISYDSDDGPGSITACYSSAVVFGEDGVGGLVGENERGKIANCYSTGRIIAKEECGGLVGDDDGEVENSFWDTETSGKVDSDGGEGLTTAEMQTAATFLEAGWDFIDETENGTDDIWWILDGQDYPRLWWEAPAE